MAKVGLKEGKSREIVRLYNWDKKVLWEKECKDKIIGMGFSYSKYFYLLTGEPDITIYNAAGKKIMYRKLLFIPNERIFNEDKNELYLTDLYGRIYYFKIGKGKYKIFYFTKDKEVMKEDDVYCMIRDFKIYKDKIICLYDCDKGSEKLYDALVIIDEEGNIIYEKRHYGRKRMYYNIEGDELELYIDNIMYKYKMKLK